MVDLLEKEALFKKGQSLYESRDYIGAEEMFKKILSEEPQNIFALNYLGLCQLNLGQFKQAIAFFTKTEERLEKTAAYPGHRLTVLKNKSACYQRLGIRQRSEAEFSFGSKRKNLFLEAGASFLRQEIIDSQVFYIENQK